MEAHIIPKKWAILPFAFLQIISLSTFYFIVPQLVISKVCRRTFNRTVCSHLGRHKFRAEETRVFNEAAAWNALIHFAAFCPALIITLPLGAMSDLVSKKKMLLVPAIANLVSCLIKLCCAIFIKVHVGFLVLASFITAIYGEFAGCIMLCSAYSSSVTNSGERTVVMIILIAVVEVGLGIGSLVGNYLLRYYGYPSVFLFVGTGLIIGLLYSIVLIPPIDDIREKSVQGERHGLRDGFKLRIKETCIRMVSFAKKRVLDSKDNTILLLCVAAFFHWASYGGERAMVALFLQHSPLGFTADKIGIFLTLYQFSRASGLIFLAIVVEKHFAVSDYTLMIVGALGAFISLVVLGFSTTTLMVYLSTIFALPTSFMVSSIRSQLTKLVSNEEYGITLSFIGLVGNAGMLIVAVGANGLFVATVKVYTGFSILLLAAIDIISVAVLFYIVCDK